MQRFRLLAMTAIAGWLMGGMQVGSRADDKPPGYVTLYVSKGSIARDSGISVAVRLVNQSDKEMKLHNHLLILHSDESPEKHLAAQVEEKRGEWKEVLGDSLVRLVIEGEARQTELYDMSQGKLSHVPIGPRGRHFLDRDLPFIGYKAGKYTLRAELVTKGQVIARSDQVELMIRGDE